MCVAIFQSPGARLTNDQLWKGWTVNSDGGGFAYINKDGSVGIDTGYLKYNDFQKKYDTLVDQYGENGPMLIHMRIRSAGDLGRANCHPFRIKGGAMIHNGTMFYPDHDSKVGTERKSDTRVFAERLHNILDLESVQKGEEGILDAVGNSNKLVFLYDTGKYHIVNEKAGFWADGIWYSNSSCRAWKPHGGK